MKHRLSTYGRHETEPMILIICINKVEVDIKNHVTASCFPGLFSFFSTPWALYCLIFSKESIKGNKTAPSRPLVALGLFFTERACSMIHQIYHTDLIMKQLYKLTLNHHHFPKEDQNASEESLQLTESQIREHDGLITFGETLGQPTFTKAISDAKGKIIGLKQNVMRQLIPILRRALQAIIVLNPKQQWALFRSSSKNEYTKAKGWIEWVVSRKGSNCSY